MLLVRPPHLADVARDMIPALHAARTAGMQHIVLLSLQGAEQNRVVPHAKLEEWLRGSGLDWTFVRPSFFMENLSGTHAADIRERDEILVPAGKGATSFVAASDVAAVAEAARLDPAAHAGRSWTPTGPAALTYAQVAATLTDVLGRPIRYLRPGALRYARHARAELGMPLPMVGVTTAIYTMARLGKAGGLTNDVRAVTGHPPVAFVDWATENREVWAR
ncbi:MAG: NmrA family NAD(P)-binding protein [Candidatus Nanopelagicales bacterium]